MKLMLPLLLLILVTSTSFAASSDANDINILRNACMQLKKAKQKECINSLAKLEGKKGVESNSNTTPQGMAKEEITFKGVPFDVPNQLDKLIGICSENKDNQEKMIGNSKFESKCKVENSGNIWFSVDYGTLKDAFMIFKLSPANALLNVAHTLNGQDVVPLVTVLTEKYGRPKIEQDVIQNKMGNNFDRQIYTWVDSKMNQIKIYSRYNKIDEGYIKIESASEIQASIKKAVDTISTGKENL